MIFVYVQNYYLVRHILSLNSKTTPNMYQHVYQSVTSSRQERRRPVLILTRVSKPRDPEILTSQTQPILATWIECN